jgi:alanine transaminase
MSTDSINQHVVKAEYAVRGELVLRAMQYRDKLSRPNHGLPFDELIMCNIGNPQALNQKPLTFNRQVMALCDYPNLLQMKGVEALFPEDARERATFNLKNMPGGTGAYTDSQGLAFVRQNVADFITNRDGHKADAQDLYLTNGASNGVTALLNILMRGPADGLMIPIPQYPLYTATIALLNGSAVKYYMDEDGKWTLSASELRRASSEARKQGVDVRALAVINPGNPTGQVLSYDNILEILEFCKEEKLVMLADEVYQENIYLAGQHFTSFRKVLLDHADKFSDLELVSFHSTSKGIIGECGRRGGYLELTNIHSDVVEQLYKLQSIGLCSNLNGQIMTDLMVKQPCPGEASYESYQAEKDGIFQSLVRRSKMVQDGLNGLEGVSCNPVEGAMYAFPKISLPAKAIEAAAAVNKSADTFYALQLLDETGICVVPGSGFGQRDGTFHFRTTILPQEEKIMDVVSKMKSFHSSFMLKYA